MMALAFAVAAFMSAALLFAVEPYVARRLLPELGGAPAVWTTCVLFFQASLLVGYGGAHHGAKLRPRVGFALYALLALGAFLTLPIVFPPGTGERLEKSSVAAGLFVLLAWRVGPAFVLLSMTAPLLQAWFTRVGKNPFPLVAASNAGSLVALLSYPFLVEPSLGLGDQSRAMRWGFVVVVVGVAACGAWASAFVSSTAPKIALAGERPSAREIARWTILAAVPSSALLGATNHLTTDVAPLPLFWVVPLAVYLATFVLVFAAKPPIPHAMVTKYLPLAVTLLFLVIVLAIAHPLWICAAVHVAVLGLASLYAHGELARTRPAASHATLFSFTMAAGGVLGGLFAAIVAPLIFTTYYEYPLSVAAICALLPAADEARWKRQAAIGVAVALALVAFGAMRFGGQLTGSRRYVLALVVGSTLFVNYALRTRPIAFALGLAGVSAAATTWSPYGHRIFGARSFFGAISVVENVERRHLLMHGTTVHGIQSPDHEDEPLAYYHPTGPIGRALGRHTELRPDAIVGIVGLGGGALAAYANRGQRWTYFEINKDIVRVAEDPAFFTFLSRARARGAEVAIDVGDARLALAARAARIAKKEEAPFTMLALDAFSSDAIPVHLLTREALAIDFATIEPHGVLAIHLSNQYIAVDRVVAAIAAADGYAALAWRDFGTTDAYAGKKLDSIWAILAHDAADLAPLAVPEGKWKPLDSGGLRPWTDDAANLLAVIGE